MRVRSHLRAWSLFGMFICGACNPISAQRPDASPPKNSDSSSPRIIARLGLDRVHVAEPLRSVGNEQHKAAAHTNPVTKLIFSPDGQLLASGSPDPSVCLWNVKTGELLAKFVGDAGGDLRFSPDGWLLGAAGRQGEYRLWEVSTGTLLMQGGRIRNLPASSESRFSPELDRLAIGYSQGQVQLIETTTGERLPALEVFDQHEVGAVAFSEDGRWLAVGAGRDRDRRSSRGSLVLWDLTENKKLRELRSPVPENASSYHQSFDGLEFSPDGGTLAARHSDLGIEFWNPTQGTRTLVVSNQRGRPMAFSRIGHVLVLMSPPGSRHPQSEYFDVQLMEVATGGVFQTWKVPNQAMAFAMSPDGELLAVSLRTAGQILLMSLESSSHPSPTEQDLKRAVDVLISHDASRARNAMATLVAAGDRAIPLLESSLENVHGPVQRNKRIRHLIQELDDDDFFVREKAMAELADLSASAVPELKTALAGSPSFEAASRMRALLKKTEDSSKRIPADLLRSVRSVEVLERIRTAKGRETLRSLAEGPESSLVATVAQSALKRIHLLQAER